MMRMTSRPASRQRSAQALRSLQARLVVIDRNPKGLDAGQDGKLGQVARVEQRPDRRRTEFWKVAQRQRGFYSFGDA
jgi:hypothetical protein